MSTLPQAKSPSDAAHFVRKALPPGGLFADQHWRISPTPFVLEPRLADELESLGRVLLQFYRAVNLLYRHSLEGKQPAWVAELLERGKPERVLRYARDKAFKNEVPRVIRPDVLITPEGAAITELDSLPGGIGLTAWLNQTYAAMGAPVLGGAEGMMRGWASIFLPGRRAHIVVSREASMYQPEMEWLAEQVNLLRGRDPGLPELLVHDQSYTGFEPGDSAYRFFELFDLDNVPCAEAMFDLALQKSLLVTPPPKTIFEEKLLLGLLHNRGLGDFWRRELGAAYYDRLRAIVPFTWIVDPTPLPPQGAFPHLNLTDWRQLQALSQRERQLVLKVSGFSDNAHSSRSVHLGHDLSQTEWAEAVEGAIREFETHPWILQRYHHTSVVPFPWYDFDAEKLVPMDGRVRLCPYYFVVGENDQARPQLGGCLATVCPSDKKVIHGMEVAVLAPCVRG